MLIINNDTIHPSFWEELHIGIFDIMTDTLISILDKASVRDKIGRYDLSSTEYDKINYHFYVIYYCLLIQYFIFEERKNKRKVTWDILNKKFKIDCIIDTMGCKGVQARIIFDYFGFNKNYKEPDQDGIEFFGIELSNPFIVTGF